MKSAIPQTTQASVITAEIVGRIEEEIGLGVLKPRERLVEDELMSRFKVKRHVIRQVLADLLIMGLVIRPPNKSATVRDFGAVEVSEMYYVRETLERSAAELMPLPAAPEVVAALTAIHKNHMAAAKAGRLREVFRLNIEFHRVFYQACGNSQLAEVIELFAFKTHATRSFTISDPALLMQASAEHANMIRLLQTKARKELMVAVVAHLQPAKEAYLRIAQGLDRRAQELEPAAS